MKTVSKLGGYELSILWKAMLATDGDSTVW